MMKALIDGTRICEVVAVGAEFPVHNNLAWVDVPDDTTARDTWENDAVVKEVLPTALEVWEIQMRGSDVLQIPRWLEDHITDDHGGTTGNAKLQEKYNAKKALRNAKPT